MLVHRHRAREHSGPDIADVGHLQEPLQGAVLAERTVQQGEHDVNLAQRPGNGARVERHQLAAMIVGEHDGGALLVDLGQAARLDREALGLVLLQDPAAFHGDTDGDHVVTFPVQGLEHTARGRAGDGVLRATPTEDDGHAWLASGLRFAGGLGALLLAHRQDPTGPP